MRRYFLSVTTLMLLTMLLSRFNAKAEQFLEITFENRLSTYLIATSKLNYIHTNNETITVFFSEGRAFKLTCNTRDDAKKLINSLKAALANNSTSVLSKGCNG